MYRLDYRLYPHLCDDHHIRVLLIPIICQVIAILRVQNISGLLYEGNDSLLANFRCAEYLGFSHSYLRFINAGLDFSCPLFKK